MILKHVYSNIIYHNIFWENIFSKKIVILTELITKYSVSNIVTVCKKAAVKATAVSSLLSYLTNYIFTTCTYGMFEQTKAGRKI